MDNIIIPSERRKKAVLQVIALLKSQARDTSKLLEKLNRHADQMDKRAEEEKQAYEQAEKDDSGIVPVLEVKQKDQTPAERKDLPEPVLKPEETALKLAQNLKTRTERLARESKE